MQQYHFELLKKAVSETSAIHNVTAADCKKLSDLIFKKTKACISETTLKRVFGLVQSRHSPSQFTLNALCKYCGYDSVSKFLTKYGQEPATPGPASWNKIAANVNNITSFTIKALKNRSGIPFKHTIARKSVSFYLDTFVASEAVATALIAPAGFGKSTALLHWLEEKLELNAVNKSGDILLFFSTQVLMSALQSGQSIHFWLLSLLGCGDPEYHELLCNAGERKFYLIIDGFDEISFRDDQFQLLLNQLIDILGIYHNSRCFKLILTTRSNTWINYGRKFGSVREKWFEGFIGDPENAVNVPLLSAPEITEISQLINPKALHEVSIEVMENLCNPLYLELYYKLSHQAFNLKISQLTRYELTGNLVLEKIYLNRFAVEKTQFLYDLISLMDLKDESNAMGRVQVAELSGKNEQIYQALDSHRFLRTINKSDVLRQNIYIEFCSKDTLEYFIAKWLLWLHGNRLNEALIGYINEYLNPNLRLSVIKWLVLSAVNAGGKSELHHLTRVSLPLNSKAGFLSFLSDVLEHEYVTLTADGTGMQKFGIKDSLLDYFISIEFISPGYLKTINTLLRFEISNDRRFLLNCYKAIMAIVTLNLELLKQQIEELREFPPATLLGYPVNPVNCITAVFNFLKYGIVNKDTLAEITRFSFNPVFFVNDSNNNEAANNMMGILMAGALVIGQNPRKLLRVINILNKSYRALPASSIAYPFILKMFFADAVFALEDLDSLLKTEEDISELTTGKQAITPYLEVLVHVLKIKIAIIQKQHEAIMNQFRIIMLLANSHNLRLVKLYTTSLLLKKYLFIDEPQFIRFYREVNYEHTKTIAETQVIEFWERQLF